MRLQYHTRNIQRIEDGSRQPGVQLALRMVVAVDAEPGEFFETLFEESVGEALDGASSPTTRVSVTYQPLGVFRALRVYSVRYWLRHG